MPFFFPNVMFLWLSVVPCRVRILGRDHLFWLLHSISLCNSLTVSLFITFLRGIYFSLFTFTNNNTLNNFIQFFCSILQHHSKVYYWDVEILRQRHWTLWHYDEGPRCRSQDAGFESWPCYLLAFPGSNDHWLFSVSFHEHVCPTSTPGIKHSAWLWSSWLYWALLEPIPSCHCLLLEPEPSRPVASHAITTLHFCTVSCPWRGLFLSLEMFFSFLFKYFIYHFCVSGAEGVHQSQNFWCHHNQKLIIPPRPFKIKPDFRIV